MTPASGTGFSGGATSQDPTGISPVIYIENSSDLLFDTIQYTNGSPVIFSINGDRCGNIRVSGTETKGPGKTAVFNYGAGEKVLTVKNIR